MPSSCGKPTAVHSQWRIQDRSFIAVSPNPIRARLPTPRWPPARTVICSSYRPQSRCAGASHDRYMRARRARFDPAARRRRRHACPAFPPADPHPPCPIPQKLLAALESATRVVELVMGGAPQTEVEARCSSFLDDVQVGVLLDRRCIESVWGREDAGSWDGVAPPEAAGMRRPNTGDAGACLPHSPLVRPTPCRARRSLK